MPPGSHKPQIEIVSRVFFGLTARRDHNTLSAGGSMRTRQSLFWTGIGIALAIVSVIVSLPRFNNVALRDHLDVLAELMNSPISFLFAFLVVVLSCQGLFGQIAERHLFYVAVRGGFRQRVTAHFATAAASAFVVGAAYVLVNATVAFAVWPALGSPGVDPSVYFLTTQTAADDALTRFTYSQWLSFGSVSFSLLYAVVVGIAAAALALIGSVVALLFNSVIGAVAVPTLGYLVATLVPAFLGTPRAGILYSIFPFGLDQARVEVGVLPVGGLVLIAVTLAGATLLRGRQVAERL